MRKMFSQIDNINKEVEIIKNKPKAYSGIENTITNENSTRKAQCQIWTDRRKRKRIREESMDLKINRLRLSSLKNRKDEKMKKIKINRTSETCMTTSILPR